MHDVGDVVQEQQLCGGRADLPGADDGHLRIRHESPPDVRAPRRARRGA